MLFASILFVFITYVKFGISNLKFDSIPQQIDTPFLYYKSFV
jgi:hypothetical protein